LIKIISAILLLTATLCGQSTPASGVKALASGDACAKAAQSLCQWQDSRVNLLMNDYGELKRYAEADQQLIAALPDPQRVVFFGDSITDGWKLDQSFPGKHYVNRGVSGQTTPQMLVRFRQDVIDLKPNAVVILAGTNDIAGNTGAETLEQIEGNYASFDQLAHSNGIRVIFSSVTPVNGYTERAQKFFAARPPQKIVALNKWLRAYCAAHQNAIYLDYFSHMVDDRGLLRRDLAEDGLHPNDAGYKIMAPLAQAAIEKARKRQTIHGSKPH